MMSLQAWRWDLVLTAVALCAYGAGCEKEPGTGGTGPHEAPQGALRPTRNKPNIIFILTDDQAPNTLGSEGNPVARTPRLDRLAAEGVFFSRAYVPIPQCAPSRAAVLTGLYPHQNGVLTNEEARLRPGAVTFAHVLRKQGYACGMIGKWHLGDPDKPQAGFEDKWVSFDVPGEYYDPELWVDGRRVRADGYLTEVLTNYAMEFVDAHVERPFLLWLNYKAPHGPVVGPADAQFRYEPQDMPLPESMKDDLSGKPHWQRESYMHEVFSGYSPEQIQRRLANYHAMISSIDHNVGRLVDHLAEVKLLADTRVIFMSDNGFLHGEHQMITKGYVFYEEVVRSPLILWQPGTIEPGRRVNTLVSSLDIFPTLCGVAGVAPPAGLPGRDLAPLLTDPSARLHDAVFFEYHTKEATGQTVPMRGLVTDRYKYVLYLDGGEELYDLQSDPHEMINLIDDYGQADTVRDLRGRLGRWRVSAGDAP
ncbi:MAG: sulfatase-like hydrolase/transferase [Phycisphaerales bacterium]|nr:MAG: sulfatase-like hydrolase/transferase [Phycisphaerales bacterium]